MRVLLDVFVGVLAYVDDVTLLAPTPRVMQLLFKMLTCFQCLKLATMCISRRKGSFCKDLQFLLLIVNV